MEQCVRKGKFQGIGKNVMRVGRVGEWWRNCWQLLDCALARKTVRTGNFYTKKVTPREGGVTRTRFGPGPLYRPAWEGFFVSGRDPLIPLCLPATVYPQGSGIDRFNPRLPKEWRLCT